jgi:hypothetical protein
LIPFVPATEELNEGSEASTCARGLTYLHPETEKAIADLIVAPSAVWAAHWPDETLTLKPREASCNVIRCHPTTDGYF